MVDNSIVFSIFVIFTGAALLSTFALLTKQSLIVAYILLGVILGPWGLKLVNDSYIIQQTGDIGIIFLLFLLGLHLDPKNLLQMLKKATWVAIASSSAFALAGYAISLYFGFSPNESMIIGAAMMFSSTIIGLKLLPTNVLHNQHTGEVMISILLLQDLLAIMVLLWLHSATIDGFGIVDVGSVVLSLPALLLFTFVFERYVLMYLFKRFDRIREYLFLIAIAWCLSVSEVAQMLKLSHEVGAFIAGVSIAVSPISLYIAESLEPVRDFFLVMFFFSVGASFNLHYLPTVITPAAILAIIMLVGKPCMFRALLGQVGENKKTGWEIGLRLGQVSEFSLLITYIAMSSSLLSDEASYLIQATTILTFIASSYLVVKKYPTPVAINN